MNLTDDQTLRPGNAIQHAATCDYAEISGIDQGKVKVYPHDNWRFLDEYKAIKLTCELLKERLGFEVHDMGDYWQCERGDFVLIQLKLKLIEMQMPFTFVLKSSINGAVSFRTVHHLQNTFLDLKEEFLEFQLALTNQ